VADGGCDSRSYWQSQFQQNQSAAEIGRGLSARRANAIPDCRDSKLFLRGTNMKRSKSIVAASFAVVALFLSAQSAQAQELRLQAPLTGATRASGQAKFEQKGTRMKFNVQIEDATRNANFGVVVRRGTLIVYRGVVRTDGFGRGVIDIDNTEGDVVPAMKALDAVIVNSGTTRYLTGSLQQR
jgi:hypothetical protein